MFGTGFLKPISAVFTLLAVGGSPAWADDAKAPTRDEAIQTLKKAATYYADKVASHGGYVYYYTPDLRQGWGEGMTGVDTIFVQPPGTPAVGMAYLHAYSAVGDPFYLEAARKTADALVQGQLQSGGWTQVIHFAKPERGKMGKYRKGSGGSWNISSLDDGQTQAALQCLMRTDAALQFKNAEIHEAAEFGLHALLRAQFPNGGFPQIWQGPVTAQPVKAATYPTHDWKTEGRVKNYWDYYTLNDGLAGSVCDTLILADRTYGDKKYREALRKLGDFLILAQMPDPQPAWCQQYDYDMHPMWARKFEPAAITGWESQDVMETLIRIARHTGDDKYLDPIPAALNYFTEKCLLPDGKVARFYELKTNKPLYMNRNYELTYDDSAVPGHYGWKQPARFERIRADYRSAKAGTAVEVKAAAAPKPAEVRRIISELDEIGRWVSSYDGERLVGQPNFSIGFRYISSDVFNRHVETLSRYIASLPKDGK